MKSTLPIVYHVGRAGDIAGGMTQVINAYLKWPFERVKIAVIESRGDPGDHIASMKGFLRAIRKVGLISRDPTPAVLVVHLSERGSFLREGTIARYASARGIPVVLHMHGSEFAAFERMKPRLVEKVLLCAKRVISLSDETSGICARYIERDRILLVPNAIPPGSPTSKTKTVVFGGVVCLRKGIDVLQEAWRRLGALDGWRLIIAGPIRDGHLVDRWLPNADFIGSLDHAALMALLDSAAVAVLPSRDEAMPMFILEAMARRACVISTSVGGIPAVLADGCGVLVAPGSVDELTTALKLVTTDGTQRECIAGKGLARFEREFSAKAVYPEVEAIWLRALS